MGLVNAEVVAYATALAPVVNVDPPFGIPIQVAGTGGVTVEYENAYEPTLPGIYHVFVTALNVILPTPIDDGVEPLIETQLLLYGIDDVE
jgi:hypothetical protein